MNLLLAKCLIRSPVYPRILYYRVWWRPSLTLLIDHRKSSIWSIKSFSNILMKAFLIEAYLNSSRSSLGLELDDQKDSSIGLQVCFDLGEWVSSSSKYVDTVLSKSSKSSFSKTSSLSSEYSRELDWKVYLVKFCRKQESLMMLSYLFPWISWVCSMN